MMFSFILNLVWVKIKVVINGYVYVWFVRKVILFYFYNFCKRYVFLGSIILEIINSL